MSDLSRLELAQKKIWRGYLPIVSCAALEQCGEELTQRRVGQFDQRTVWRGVPDVESRLIDHADTKLVVKLAAQLRRHAAGGGKTQQTVKVSERKKEGANLAVLSLTGSKGAQLSEPHVGELDFDVQDLFLRLPTMSRCGFPDQRPG